MIFDTAQRRKEYEVYIKSARWKNLRELLFRVRGKKCEVCGYPAPSLDVHHLDYERFGKERLQDLQIVCRDCHERQDRKRERQQSKRREMRRLDAAFVTWCERGGIVEPDEYEWERFVEWMDGQYENAV